MPAADKIRILARSVALAACWGAPAGLAVALLAWPVAGWSWSLLGAGIIASTGGAWIALVRCALLLGALETRFAEQLTEAAGLIALHALEQSAAERAALMLDAELAEAMLAWHRRQGTTVH